MQDVLTAAIVSQEVYRPSEEQRAIITSNQSALTLGGPPQDGDRARGCSRLVTPKPQ